MEDRIFYVEGPEGDILGPLTMIQILEGIAAEAILEDARLCEVGREEWLELSDVVATRNGHGASEHGAPETALQAFGGSARENAGMPPEIETAIVDANFNEGDLQQIQTAALHEMDLAEEMREEDLVIEASAEIDFSGISLSDDEPASNGFEEPVEITQDEEISLFEHNDALVPNDDLAPASASRGASAGMYIEGVREPAVPEVDFDATVLAAPGSGFDFGSISIQAHDGPSASSSRSESPTRGELGDDAFDLGDGGAFAGNAPHEGGEDFRLDLAEQSAVHAGDGDSGTRRPRWLVPASIVATVAVILVVYFVIAGRGAIEQGPGDGEAAPSIAAAPPASESDRSKALAFLEAGRAKLEQKDASGSVTAFTKALELDPHLAEAHEELAHALAATGRKSPAIEEMSAYLASVPDDLEAQRARLDWMLATGETGEAGIVYGELAAKYPESAPFQTMAGLAKGESEDAMNHLRRAIAIDPKDAQAYAALGAVAAKLGRPLDAVDAFEKAFALRPPTKSEKKLFDQVKESAKTAKAADSLDGAPPARTPEFAALVREVRGALALENYDDAMKAIDAGKKTFGKDAEANRNLEFLRGLTDFEAGRYDRAITKLESLDPKATYETAGAGRGALANWIALARLAKGDFRGAVRDFGLNENEADPNEYATAKLWEGVALQSLGMDDLAKRTWKLIPGEVGTKVQSEGKAAVKTAQYLSGILSEKEYLESVASVNDFANDMHYFLARAARDRADSSGAAEHFRRSLEASRGREFPYALAESEASGESSPSRDSTAR